VILLFPVAYISNSSYANVFPGNDWIETSPESQGVHSTKLNEAIIYLEANSGSDGVKELVIIRNGYMIYKGTNIDNVHGVWSFTKSFTSTVLGLLIAEGKTTLDTKAKDHLSSMAASYPDVTLRHFATMTSGYYAIGDEVHGDYTWGPSVTPFNPSPDPLFKPPSTKYAYWDSAINQFANVITRIADEPLENLLKRKVADPIGMNSAKWGWKDFGIIDGIVANGGSGNHNRHMIISAREAARFGHLFLNNGRWNRVDIISSDWVREATSVQVPRTIQLGDPINSPIEGRGVYGFNWWVNGIKPDGKRKWPDAPSSTYSASGYNNNDMFIIPEWNMVIVRLGLDEEEKTITDDIYGNFLKKIGDALILESPPRVNNFTLGN
jgi:CubicO group peptidase (beta-lactamase class C family)